MAAPGGLEQVVRGVEGLGAGRRPHRARRRPGAGAPARAGRRAARPSPADGSPSPPAIDSSPDRPPARPSRGPVPPRDRGVLVPVRRSPCRVPRAPTTCTASPSRTTRACRPTAGRVAFTVKRPAVGQRRLPARRSGPHRPTARAPARQAHARVAVGPSTRGSRRTARTLAFISDRRLYVEEEPDRPKEAKERDDCDPGPPAAARRRRGAPPDGPAAGRDRLRVVARRRDARRPRRARSARRRPRTRRRRGRPAEAQARRDAAVRLPLHRPARLPVQRRRASSTTRTRTCGWSTSRRARRGRWSPGRRPRASPPGRRTAPGSRSPPTAAAARTSTGARRSSSWTSRRGEVTTIAGGARRAVRRADLDAGRRLDPRHRRAVPARLLPDRDLGASPPTASDAGPARRHGPARRERAQARRGDEQRRDARRGPARHPGRRTATTRPVHGAGRRLATSCGGCALDGGGEPERLTDGPPLPVRLGRRRGGRAIATWSRRSARPATTLPEVVAFEVGAKARPKAPRTADGAQRRAAARSSRSVEPVDRRWQSDGREIQGWLLPGRRAGAQPLVLEIHGGPHTLYGWSPMLEWQILAGSGVSVLASNPRGSEGYGEAFNRANLGDWGDGPMADVHRRRGPGDRRRPRRPGAARA